MVKRALISVTDKSNLDVLVAGLSRHDYEIVSTGGTATKIRRIADENNYGINVIDASEVTGYPELFGGRVKTLHPAILGGILYERDNQEHVRQAQENHIKPIDIVVINLYEFEKTAAKEGVTEAEVVESIDIGGPTAMISGIKNCQDVGVVADPESYQSLVEELDDNAGELTAETKRTLAAFAINRIADYRSANAVELTRRFTGEETLRQIFVQGRRLGRYGENWHQQAWLFVTPGETEPNMVTARQVHGGDLGYNNYVDAEAALQTVKEFSDPAVVVVKHTNPCGIATSDTLENALERAWQGDPVSAFGSIIAANREVDLATIKVITERVNPQGKNGWFVEVMVAPSFSQEVLDYVRERKSKKNLRLLEVGDLNHGQGENFEQRQILGGILRQTKDDKNYLTDSIDELFKDRYQLTCQNSGKELTVGIVTERKPEEKKRGLYDFANKAAKHTKSNAIVIAREYAPGQYQVLAMGAGQPNRKDSGGKLAATKAYDNLEMEYKILLGEANEAATAMLASEHEKLMATKDERVKGMNREEYIKYQLEENCVLASDAFFPFADGLIAATELGVKNIIQPGGSMGDKGVIEAANEYNVAMIFTGMRHFKH